MHVKYDDWLGTSVPTRLLLTYFTSTLRTAYFHHFESLLFLWKFRLITFQQ